MGRFLDKINEYKANANYTFIDYGNQYFTVTIRILLIKSVLLLLFNTYMLYNSYAGVIPCGWGSECSS